MGIWSAIIKGLGTAAKASGGAIKASGEVIKTGGRAVGNAAPGIGSGVGHLADGAGKGAGQVINGAGRVVSGVGGVVESVARHPMRWVAGGGAGYLMWEHVTTGKSVARVASETLIGEDATEKTTELISDLKETKDSLGNAMDKMSGAAEGVSGMFDGVKNFFRNITNGNALDMVGSFINNLGHGKVGGMSVVGLIASAFLCFGRFGWLGKIAGALLGMLVMGNNSQTVAQSQSATTRGGGRAATAQEAYERITTPAVAAEPAEQQVPVMHR